MKTAGLILLTFLLGACGDRGAAPPPEADQGNQSASIASTASAAAPAMDDGKVECALAGAATFERVCTIERTDGPKGRVLTLRAPDGGFRRLLVTRDGRGVIAADGAEPARVSILSPEAIEVAIGRDRYRLPAAVKS